MMEHAGCHALRNAAAGPGRQVPIADAHAPPSCSSSLTTRLPGGRITHHDQTDADDDRLIFLADAVTLVPFSETTLRRAIARGELQAWQPNRDGKLVMWRSALIEWATRRPAIGP